LRVLFLLPALSTMLSFGAPNMKKNAFMIRNPVIAAAHFFPFFFFPLAPVVAAGAAEGVAAVSVSTAGAGAGGASVIAVSIVPIYQSNSLPLLPILSQLLRTPPHPLRGTYQSQPSAAAPSALLPTDAIPRSTGQHLRSCPCGTLSPRPRLGRRSLASAILCPAPTRGTSSLLLSREVSPARDPRWRSDGGIGEGEGGGEVQWRAKRAKAARTRW
jgi:hypothetical protein